MLSIFFLKTPYNIYMRTFPALTLYMRTEEAHSKTFERRDTGSRRRRSLPFHCRSLQAVSNLKNLIIFDAEAMCCIMPCRAMSSCASFNLELGMTGAGARNGLPAIGGLQSSELNIIPL